MGNEGSSSVVQECIDPMSATVIAVGNEHINASINVEGNEEISNVSDHTDNIVGEGDESDINDGSDFEYFLDGDDINDNCDPLDNNNENNQAKLDPEYTSYSALIFDDFTATYQIGIKVLFMI